MSELDLGGCRRLAASALLAAALDAQAGDAGALAWLESELAHSWAALLGLGGVWPPRPGQLASRRDLTTRARELMLAE